VLQSTLRDTIEFTAAELSYLSGLVGDFSRPRGNQRGYRFVENILRSRGDVDEGTLMWFQQVNKRGHSPFIAGISPFSKSARAARPRHGFQGWVRPSWGELGKKSGISGACFREGGACPCLLKSIIATRPRPTGGRNPRQGRGARHIADPLCPGRRYYQRHQCHHDRRDRPARRAGHHPGPRRRRPLCRGLSAQQGCRLRRP